MAQKFLLFLLAFAQCLVAGAAEPGPAAGEHDPRVTPGASFEIPMDDLGDTWDGKKARAGVFIPNDFTFDKKFPAVIYFDPYHGGTDTNFFRTITESNTWIILALPYPPTGWNAPLSWYDAMLQRVYPLLPNLRRDKLVAAGFASGGGAAGAMAIRGSHYFCAAIVVAYAPNTDDLGLRPKNSLDWPALLIMGQNDTHHMDGFRQFRDYLKSASFDVTYLEVPGVDHGWPESTYPQARDFLRNKALYRGVAEALAAIERQLAGKKWLAALKSARFVLDIADPAQPEIAKAKEALPKIYEGGEEILGKLGATPKAAELKKFIKDWEGAPFEEKARTLYNQLGETELAKAVATESYARRAKLKTCLAAWAGFPVYQKTLDAFEQEARKALAALTQTEDKKTRCRDLQAFAADWSPAPVASEALALREKTAQELLAEIKALTTPFIQKASLREFVHSLGDTAAGKEAKQMLEADKGK